MESYLLKSSIGTVASNKIYCAGQVVMHNAKQTRDNDTEYTTSIRFTSKPWQYLYDNMKDRRVYRSKSDATTNHCFVVSVLQPYFAGIYIYHHYIEQLTNMITN